MPTISRPLTTAELNERAGRAPRFDRSPYIAIFEYAKANGNGAEVLLDEGEDLKQEMIRLARSCFEYDENLRVKFMKPVRENSIRFRFAVGPFERRTRKPKLPAHAEAVPV